MTAQILSFLFFFSSFVIKGKVINVTDGDTVNILTTEKLIYKIRLENIDAPEKGQAFYKNSKQLLSAKIKGKQVNFTITKKDKYSRWLGTINYNATNIFGSSVYLH